MPKYEWISIGDTHLLMELQLHGELEEWHKIAQVTRRQIYPSVPPRYYAWLFDDVRGFSTSVAADEAKALIEARMGISSARSERCPVTR